ncbi:HAD hydrolase family protein [Collinsella sp. zg1085]|uniref:HAD family hydrolase n=1 Tax=Collinsella sp. zg1085 TaxID=2844380 RepID=UPI001C0CC12A|nr:HAD hydrolase family protein [Collinsella sp. zg1085]QWT17911.1 HAD hydrolase family protein [Collinsella sp. zg1085]
MSYTYLPEQASGELRERLSKIRYVFTDMDGTMLAPGSTVLADAEGNPSLALSSTLVELRQAGIEVIPCSGRNRSMLHEDVRVLGLNAYIGEMGGLIMFSHKDSHWEYFTADMDYDPACGLTPHQVIEATGVCDLFSTRWPGLLEYHNDMSRGYKYREVTVALRGEIPDEDAYEILSKSGLALEWGDNGFLGYISAPTTLTLPEGVPGRAYNISPAGLNKGRAIARFCEIRGIDPASTLSLGDSRADYSMADVTGLFFLVENGLENADAAEFLQQHDHAYVARGRSCDGWVAAMQTVLEAAHNH